MSKKQLLKLYNESFSIVMDEKRNKRDRFWQAVRAATLAEVMKDQQRIYNAVIAADCLNKSF